MASSGQVSGAADPNHSRGGHERSECLDAYRSSAASAVRRQLAPHVARVPIHLCRARKDEHSQKLDGVRA